MNEIETNDLTHAAVKWPTCVMWDVGIENMKMAGLTSECQKFQILVRYQVITTSCRNFPFRFEKTWDYVLRYELRAMFQLDVG